MMCGYFGIAVLPQLHFTCKVIKRADHCSRLPDKKPSGIYHSNFPSIQSSFDTLVQLTQFDRTYDV